MQNDQPFTFSRGDGFQRLRQVFDAAGYSNEGVAERLGIGDARSFSQQSMTRLLQATEQCTPLDVLIRLFLIGSTLDKNHVEKAARPMSLQEWAEAGLIEVRGQSASGRLEILPYEGIRVAFDQPRGIKTGLAEDYVMGIGSSTLTLGNLTVRRPSSASLDLGTGCGFLAFLAASHSQQVTAIDRNPRAVRLARFNAELNGLSNVECLEGDLFEPVAGRKFDLVVSNPPFVISPETRYIYRDSGMKGDEITRKIVRRVPEFLTESGFCQILCNWAHLRGQDWRQRLGEWFEQLGCDAWVMRSDTLEAEAYASKWIRHTERDDDAGFERRYQQWTDYYRREGIEAVSGGLITMRRRTGGSANWFRADDGPEKMIGPAGEDIAVAFEQRDFVEANRDDATLAGRCLRISPHARLRQCFQPTESGWHPTESQLTLERGLAYTGTVDPYVAELLAGCNGKRTLHELIAAMAQSVDQDVSEIRPACLEIIRRLLERGFLICP